MKPIRNKFEFDPRDLSDKYADAMLTTKEATGEEVIKVHRVFLAALSNKFESLFDESKSRHELIVVRNISFEILSDIVKFLYTGKAILADKGKEYIEDFRDGLNMLKIDISDKADSKISEELKEVKSRQSAQKPSVSGLEVVSKNVVKKPSNSDGNKSYSSEDINANRKRSRDQFKDSSSKKIKEERAIGDGEKYIGDTDESPDPRKRFVSSDKTGDGAMSEFDLRGKLVGNKIRQIRNSLEGGRRSVSQSLERSIERIPERGSQKVSERSMEGTSKRTMEKQIPERYTERRISERSLERGASSDRRSMEGRIPSQDYSSGYCFDPKRPRADPNWEPEKQVMIGPLPGSVTYQHLQQELAKLGGVHRIFLQFSNKWKFQEAHNQNRYAYAVFREQSAAQQLLAASCIKIVGDYFGVGRMPGGGRAWGY